MSEKFYRDILTVGIGGAAGEGVKRAGVKIGEFLRSSGYEVYISFDYPSLIRGGHNFVRLTASKERVWQDHSGLDIMVASSQSHADLHKSELKEGAKILAPASLDKIAENPESVFEGVNIEKGETKGELLDGNTAFAKGLQAAGLDFYISYPMTPSTSVLHYLASKQAKDGLKVIQPENEIAAINMALGCAYAGKRAAVGSATGGFALMQEAFSFSGMAELPLVVMVSQRQAPATGVPTHSSQSDLRFAIHAGHGEFPRIVLAPGDIEEAYNAGVDSLNLAWKFRTPVIVLLDKILSEHMMTAGIERWKDGKMERFENAAMAIPGTPGQTVKVTSYEHDESGITVDKPSEVKERVEKRFSKSQGIEADMRGSEAVKVYGDPDSKEAIVFWGSTKCAVLEAAKLLDKPVKLVQILWMEPFDVERVKKELLTAENIIDVEGNHEAQLAGLIKEKTGIDIAHKILKYDSDPFDPEKLAEEIKKRLSSKKPVSRLSKILSLNI